MDENTQKNDAIFDIISTLQAKMSSPSSDHVEPISESNAQNSSSGIAQNNIMELLKTIGNQNNNQIEQKTSFVGNNNESNSPNLNLDPSVIMNLTKMFSSNTSQTDPRKNLLYSLKPFLRETRQKNIDTYVTLLGVINALKIFSNRGSD